MRVSRLGSIAVLVLAAAGGLLAQSESASIVGTITDSSSAIVPGATVSIRNNQTNATVSLKTGQDGNYASPPLPSGAWCRELIWTWISTREWTSRCSPAP
jgi:hypothetical protein